MKKKVPAIIAVFLVIGVGYFFLTRYIPAIFRYQTPEESFQKNAPSDWSLIEIQEDQDVALILYQDENSTFSSKIIAKDSRGWTSIYAPQKTKKTVPIDRGFLYIQEIQGKQIVKIVAFEDADTEIPAISDSAESNFSTVICEVASGRIFHHSFAVINPPITEDYYIIIGTQKITPNS